jgi:hypothetical protein
MLVPMAVSSSAPDVRAPRTLRLADCEKEPLAGEGNYLYKIPFEDGFAVVKVYYGSKHLLRHIKKTITNTIITGRTSHMPRGRFRTERDCIEIWERHGFRCFGTRPEVSFSDLPDDGYMLFEYTPGVHFREYFRDESVPLDERMATWRRFLGEWHRRHAIAVRENEPRLLHENGDVKHVMLWQGDLVYFDFEICFRSHRIPDLVGREILAYMRSTGKFFGDAMYDRMMDELVEHYPDKALLRGAWEHAFRNRNPIVRFGRLVDRWVRSRHRGKRYSKYPVALDIKRRLDVAAR